MRVQQGFGDPKHLKTHPKPVQMLLLSVLIAIVIVIVCRFCFPLCLLIVSEELLAPSGISFWLFTGHPREYEKRCVYTYIYTYIYICIYIF